MPNGPIGRNTAVTLTTTAATTALSLTDAYTGVTTTLTPVAGAGETVQISGTANVTAGTGTTAVTVKCLDQNSNQVGTTQTHTLAAGASGNVSFTFADTRNLIGPTTYNIVFTQVGATANGAVNEIVGSTSTVG